MNYIDLILGVLLFIAAIRGFGRGFVSEVASLVALVLGIWGALRFSHLTGQFLVETFDFQSKYMGLISFFVTFVLIVVVVQLISHAVEKIIDSIALGFLNRLAGLLFGIIKTALILSVVLIVFDEVDENVGILPEGKKDESHIYGPLKNLVPTIFPFVKFWDEFDYFEKDGNNQKHNNEKVA
ncbi:CvpA family protein [Sunxiuqinia sp. A32]|uniref:CvpA family protein n=1 Tax=Sunxiuqinia sp. A32 TaxID=3461496 RepID=UPI0040464DF2